MTQASRERGRPPAGAGRSVGTARRR